MQSLPDKPLHLDETLTQIKLRCGNNPSRPAKQAGRDIVSR
jgi:hypothetical protein